MLGLGLGLHKSQYLAPFNPLKLPNLELWLDGTDADTINSKVGADFVSANNEYLSSASTDFQPTDSDFSFGCWVNLDTLTGSIGGVGGVSGDLCYIIYNNSTTIEARISTNGTSWATAQDTSTTIAIDTWYFVTFVYDSVNDLVKVSVNGNSFNTAVAVGGVGGTYTNDFGIGSNGYTSYIDGSIDAPFFYDKALTLAEVKALYNSGNGVDYPSLTDLNGTQYAIGQDFTAASSQYLSSASTDFDKTDSDFSFGGWFKNNGTPIASEGCIAKWNGTGNQKSYLLFYDAGNGFIFRVTNDGSTNVSTAAVSVTETNWNFVVCVHDSVNDLIKISVNGATFVTTAFSGGVFDTTQDFQIGTLTSGTSGIDGQIDSPFFYNKALTQAESDALYNSGSGVSYSDLSTAQKTSLVSWWELNDIEGANQTDSVTASANDLTPTNNPVSTTGKVTDTTIATIESSLVEWWRLNETSGNRSGELGHTLTDNNTVGYAAGHVSEKTQSGSFAVTLPSGSHALNLDSIVTDITSSTTGVISGWLKPLDATPTANMVIMSISDASANEWIGVQLLTSGTVYIYCVVAGSERWRWSSNGAWFSDNTWAHFTMVQDGTSPKFYKDGVERVGTFLTSTDKTVWFNSLTNLDTGRFGCLKYNSAANAQYFNGDLDEWGFWTNDSSVTVASLYNGGAGKTFTDLTTAEKVGLVGYYSLDDINDLSANANHLTEIGTPTFTAEGIIKLPEPVNLWTDKSGNGLDAIQATVTRQPTWNAAGYLEFDGVNDRLANTAKTSRANGTLHIVVDWQDLATYNHVFTDTISINGLMITARSGTTISTIVNGAAFTNLTTSAAINTKYLVSVKWTGTSYETWLNGVLVNDATWTAPSIGTDGYIIGEWYNGTGDAEMKIYEVIRSESEDSAYNFTRTMNYLLAKHSIS